MTHTLIIINYGFVLLFGTVLSLAFAGIGFSENKKFYTTLLVLFGGLQCVIYFFIGETFLFKSYPILIHLPLFLILKYYCKKSTYLAAIAVLSAYLFCTPRKWIGTFVSVLFAYDMNISYITQILITLPLMWLIIRYVSPYVVRLQFEDNKILKLFMSVPLIYYCIEYALTVYTDLLYTGGAAIIEFMDASIVVVYFIFSVIYLKTLYEKKEVEVEHAILKVVSSQAEVELENLKEVQRQAAIYRHDLRHHLNFLNGCITQGTLDTANAYIHDLLKEMDNHQRVTYSENEAINLILCSYLSKAEAHTIHSQVKVSATDFEKYSVFDLCSLLSNALENAIHACADVADPNQRQLKIHIFTRNKKLCMDIKNTFEHPPIFEHDYPVSYKENHGIGTKSMMSIVAKYQGVCQFSVKEHWFTFQAVL